MFNNCSSLEKLELGNFNTLSTYNMENMFANCISLTSLNINSFNTQNVGNYNNIFLGLQNSLKICLNDDIKEEIKSQLSEFQKVNCAELCQENGQNKYIYEQNKCIDSCSNDNDNTYIYEYNDGCYSSCPNEGYSISNINLCVDTIPPGYYISDNGNKIIDKCDNKCNSCSLESISKNKCISCNIEQNYYPKSDDSNSFKECYSGEQIGYYIDVVNNIYNLCHETCKKCNGPENNECTECNDNYNLNNGKCDNSSESHIFYDLNSDISELKNKYTNTTFIDVSQELIDFIYSHFKLVKNIDKIFIQVNDDKSEDQNKVTSEYDYRIFLENGTELNLS